MKNMNKSPEVSQLENMLNQQKLMILKTKTILREKKRLDQERNATPFHESKLGRGLLNVTEFISRPFSRLNENANTALDEPALFRAKLLVKEFDSLNTSVKKFTNSEQEYQNKHPEKNAKFARDAQLLKLKLEDFKSKNPGIMVEKIEEINEALKFMMTRIHDSMMKSPKLAQVLETLKQAESQKAAEPTEPAPEAA